MEHPVSLDQAQTFFGRIAVDQDFFWFFCLLVWSLALIVWWQHPRRREVWAWVPGAAVAAIATTLIQFGMFNPTFDFFQDRLVPGTISQYRPALIDPYWLADVLQGVALAAMATIWCWDVARQGRRPAWRWIGLMAATLAAGIHAADPYRGGLGLTALALAAGGALFTHAKPARAWSRTGLLLAMLLPVVSTVGPLAALLHTIQRFGPPAPVGLAAATYQLLLGTLLLAGLLLGLRERMQGASHADFRRDAKRFGVAGAVLLLAGMAFAIETGRDNRLEIQQNRLRTTAAHARVFEPALLAPLVAPEFTIDWKSRDGESFPARSAWLANGKADAARQRLAEVVVATPFLRSARLLVIKDGWLVAALTSVPGTPPGTVEILRRATPEDYERWEKREPYVEVCPVPEIGYDYYCRAPILAADGRMLAWLDCVRSEYYLSVERRWRVAPFLFTALGLVLLTLLVVQRQSTRGRESALRAAALAAEASRIKSTFLANVSHELRTPLQSILGYSELLLHDLPGEQHRARLSALHDQGELMTRLINDLIDLSAVEAGSFQLVLWPVSPAELVRQTERTLAARATAKGLYLQTAISAGVPAWVKADGDRLRQVLLNLTGNAIKFTDRGGITVSLRTTEAGAGRVRPEIIVRDTGPGIPAAQQSRLFTPFTRLEKTADKEGSGLGLALSASLVRAMGGEISVESDGLTGSCFSATFTCEIAAEPAEPAETAPASRHPAPASPRVLVVDDNTLVRELFVTSLRDHGATCRSAGSGAEAVGRLQAEAADVVVLDLALPDGDGAAWVSRFRELVPGMRIIGASAHVGESDRERALAAGMDGFLVKPVPLDHLWAAVAGLTPTATHFSPARFMRDRLEKEFIDELPGKRAALEAAVKARDWPAVRFTAHYLRNSALVVGAQNILEACSGLEKAAEAESPADVQRWWPACRHALWMPPNGPGGPGELPRS